MYAPFVFSVSLGRFDAVHNWHVQIHEHHIEDISEVTYAQGTRVVVFEWVSEMK